MPLSLVQVTTMERFLSYHIQCNEAFRRLKLPACSAAAGRPVLTSVIILDMEGFSLQRHMTVQVKKFLEKLSRVDQVRRGRGQVCLGGGEGVRCRAG